MKKEYGFGVWRKGYEFDEQTVSDISRGVCYMVNQLVGEEYILGLNISSNKECVTIMFRPMSGVYPTPKYKDILLDGDKECIYRYFEGEIDGV